MTRQKSVALDRFVTTQLLTCGFLLLLGWSSIAAGNANETDVEIESTILSVATPGVPEAEEAGAYADINGLKMYYEIHGAGPPLLLLHGGTSHIPERWIGFLSKSYQVIAMEQLGHGRTGDIANRPFHYHDMAEDTIELMRQLGIDRAIVVGYSDGGNIGLDMAINHPDKVSKLVVTGAQIRTDGLEPDTWKSLNSSAVEEWQAPEGYRRLSPDGADHWPVFRNRIVQMWLTEPNFTQDQVRNITAPTLVIVGDRDMITPEHAVEMFKLLPHGQLCIVPNSGHGVMPQETVLEFLAAQSSEVEN